MLRAACTLAFHGFLRCSEFTSNLPRSNVKVKQQPRPHLELTLQSSKTDPFRRGATVTIGPSGDTCCAVSALGDYLKATQHLDDRSPLFQLSSGLPLSRPLLTQYIQRVLLEAGVPQASQYMSHSFRIGAATSAAEAGIPSWLIKTMGRWSSEAYKVYIRTPLSTRLAVAAHLSPASQAVTPCQGSGKRQPSPEQSELNTRAPSSTQ